MYSRRWDRIGLLRAQEVARLSKNPVMKLGAALYDIDHRPRAEAYNGMPRRIIDLPARLNRPDLRNFLELSAIDTVLYLAAEYGVAMIGCTLYCAPRAPTLREAPLIIRAGCERVVYAVHSVYAEYPHLTSRKLLEECGVECKAIGEA